jgi:uncharacterized protein YndB with AHSA1/START domain
VVRVTRFVVAPIDRVFRAICDPHTYPSWLVGAREIRSVDDEWPEPGSAFHHRVGLVGPLTVADSSEVLEIEPPRLLVLEVRARPFGRARAEFHLEQVPPGADGQQRTRITLAETPIGALAPLSPVLDKTIEPRNRASLNALVARLNEPDPF